VLDDGDYTESMMTVKPIFLLCDATIIMAE
jgi:hypothetical protein